MNGRPTTKSISEEMARKCQTRIDNYKELQKIIAQAVEDALNQAPWMRERNK